jgi:hypothetical protein
MCCTGCRSLQQKAVACTHQVVEVPAVAEALVAAVCRKSNRGKRHTAASQSRGFGQMQPPACTVQDTTVAAHDDCYRVFHFMSAACTATSTSTRTHLHSNSCVTCAQQTSLTSRVQPRTVPRTWCPAQSSTGATPTTAGARTQNSGRTIRRCTDQPVQSVSPTAGAADVHVEQLASCCALLCAARAAVVLRQCPHSYLLCFLLIVLSCRPACALVTAATTHAATLQHKN